MHRGSITGRNAVPLYMMFSQAASAKLSAAAVSLSPMTLQRACTAEAEKVYSIPDGRGCGSSDYMVEGDRAR